MPPALEDGGAQPVDAVAVGKIERHQRRRAAKPLDLVVELFQSAHGQRYRDHMGTAPPRFAGGSIADAPRGTGNEDDLACQILSGGNLCSSH